MTGRAGSGWSPAFLALRSILWALLAPGVVAGYVPWRYFGLDRLTLDLASPSQVVGLVLIGGGAALLAACIWQFAAEGRGTLSPVDAPREIVVRGLYRFVRNPMYLSVSAIVLGEAALARSKALVLYWAAVFLAFNLFVLLYEEPALTRRFGASYEAYARRVPRWIPRWRPPPESSR